MLRADESTSHDKKENSASSKPLGIASINGTLFSQSSKTSSAIFDCFPGGRQGLIKLVFEKTRKYLLLTDVIPAIELIVKNKILSNKQLINWRNELQKLPNFESNIEIVNAIGILTLCSDEIKHIAYVIDGDRRWANQNGVPIAKAHEKAFVTVIPGVAQNIFEFGIHTFSIWHFKEKNIFTRSKEEVIESILQYMINALNVYLEMAKKFNIRIFHIGNKHCSHPDPDIQNYFKLLMDKFNLVEKETKHFTRHHLVIGANYEREDDLLRAIRKINSQKINLDELKPEDIIKFTDMGNQLFPCPDLFIRSAMPYGGGRTGGFLPVTSETCLFFTPTVAPDLTTKDIIAGAAKFAHPLVRYKSADNFNRSNQTIVPSSIRSRL